MKTGNTILRSILSLFIIISMLPIAALTANAETGEITVDGIKYEYDTSEMEAAVVKYEGNDVDITIPSTVTVNGTDCSVTSIGDSAFRFCASLVSITIPSSVTSIGDSAFSDCSYLSSVTIPSSVTSIGNSAFKYCESLSSVTIPDSVTSIGDSAFSNCHSLASVTIPYSVTSIGDSAFSDCSSLASVIIPSSVTSIGDGAFYNCTSLTSVTIPDSVTSIGDNAFYYCTSLTSVTIPDSVTSIGDGAFSDCRSLTSVTIPSSVTSIGNGAFQFCFSLASVTIPSSVTSIGKEAFNDCNSLTGILVAEDNPSYMSEDGVLFSKDGKTLITWPDGKRSDSYTVPSTVTNIMSRAFDYHSPSVITIPSSVKNIDNDAFFFANTKTTIIESKDISIGLSAFEATKLESLYFTGTKDEWSGVSKGNNWCLSSKLGNDPAVKQVTLKVANGKWNDGTTADRVITVVGNNADKLIGSVIPTVGSKPATDYAAGSWDNDPLAATLTGDTVFTYTYSKTAGTAVTAKITVSKTDITGENTVEDALLSLSVQGLTDDQIENIIESNEGNGLKNWSTAQDGNTFTMSWVSGSKAADIKGLAPGTYTLAETGDAFESNGVTYEVLDSEVVFVINESGKVIYRTVPAPSDELNPENSTISYARASGNTFTVCDASRTDITVSKKEITNTEEIKGAHLVIEDRAGNVIDEWDSNGSDHIVKALANGTYVLTETAVDSEQAGSAYKIIPSSVYFTVLNGKITEVTSRILADKPENGSKDGYVLCNEDENLITVCDAKQTTKVTVNKYDITGKEELDGAILTIKDSDGKTVTGTPWTSLKGRKLVVELENGTYTLTETGDTVTDEDGNEYEIIDSTLTFSVENGRLTVVDNSTSSNSGDGFYDVDSDTNSIAVNDVMKTQEATITWKQDDGTVIDTTSVKYGQSPTHKDPTKQKDNQYIYTFTGWSDGTNTYGKNDTLPEVTGDATYTAVYSQRSYMGSVKFIAVAEDDRIKSQTVVIKVFDSATEGTNYTSYGAISVSGTGEFNTTITHIPEGDYTYSEEPGNPDTYVSPRTGTFSITGEETTEVKFNLVIPVKSYRVTFVNDDGEFTILQSTLVDEGETPVYSGNTPTKQGDAHYSYEFAGWGDGDNAYDVGVTLPEVTGDVTYTAVYDSSVNSYTITWEQDDGTAIDTTSVEYGVTPKHDDPTKDADAQYTYTFAGWTPEIVSVEGEKTYTATYTATLRSYTITWQHDDGTEIDTTTVEYGQTPTHSDPKKEATAEFTYTFTGWDPEISSVKGETAYKATYSATVNEYTIIFKNEDGTVLQTVTVAYGETPEYTGETPTKAEDAENTYIFAGWNQDISAVTGETEYTATFTATQKASPDTGDSSLEIWAIAMVASFACLAMIPVYGRKRAKEK